MASVDTFLIAGGGGMHALCEDAAIVAWLKRMAPKFRRLGSICTGAFLLGAAGLLDGRRAVTHWNWCDRLSARHPGVEVERDPIYVNDKGVWTSAGVTAGIDMALAMIEEDHGAKLALRTAQELVVFRKRPGGQSQFGAELALARGGRPAARYLARLDPWPSRRRSLGAGPGRARRHEPAQFRPRCSRRMRECRRRSSSNWRGSQAARRRLEEIERPGGADRGSLRLWQRRRHGAAPCCASLA